MSSTPSIELGRIAESMGLASSRVQAVADLLDAGNTVPFITRYRKDQTGGLDEEQIRQIESRVVKFRLLAERKQTILRSIDAQGRLTSELVAAVYAADTTKRLEDLYLPFKPKKQTLATLARTRGLEPLSIEILAGSPSCFDALARARDFVNPDRQVHSAADALLGAGHILAESFAERADLRGRLRSILEQTGRLVTTANPVEQVETASPTALTTAATREAPPSPAAAVNESKKSAISAPDGPPSPAVEQTGEIQLQFAQTSAASFEQTPDASQADMTAASGTENPAGFPAEASETGPTAVAVEPAPAPIAPAKRKPKKNDSHNAFRDYFQYGEALFKVPPHRMLAINRGERARAIRVKVECDLEAMQRVVDEMLVAEDHPHADFIRGCGRDALSRLILPSLEREVRRELTDRAELHAVQVFARNLRNLLLQPPVRDRRVLAIDPAYKSGCKLVALDEFGNLLDHAVAHRVGPPEKRAEADRKVVDMVRAHQLTVVAIGNGSGCRDTERWISDLITGELAEAGVSYTIVNEAGASVYSTSPLGREELPRNDATQRGAISIGRRLQDPLSELVKIDAASIGVGMYQHDVKAKHLRQSLDEVVASCVNFVGVDLNSASPALLKYVSGLNQLTAQRVYEYRTTRGPFKSREELKQVQGIGEASYVQAAGFLKVIGGSNPLDATWIHPESHDAARQVLAKLEASPDDLADKERSAHLGERAARLAAAGKPEVERMAEELKIGVLTLSDILAQLSRPGRDPRESLPPPVFKRGILKLDNLTSGMELSGTVLNVVDFGAFVDIGLKDSGLVHISQMADKFVNDPHQVVAVGDIVHVWVLDVDKERRRVSLTMIPPGQQRRRAEPRRSTGEGRARPEGGQTQGAAPLEQERRPKRVPKRVPQGATQGPAQGAAQGVGSGQSPAHTRSKGPHGGRKPTNRSPEPAAVVPPKPRPKPRPIVPLTDAMREGKAPLRTFGDLKQFFDLKSQPPENEGEPPSS